MKHTPHPKTFLIALTCCALLGACGSAPPTGVENDDVRGTWSGTFDSFSLLGRTLSGDADWTFSRDTFEIIFFNPPEGQAERISGDWKFTGGRIAIELKSSFPIDSDVGAKDTLFVSILRDEMSLKSIADSSILLVKTRLTLLGQPAAGDHAVRSTLPAIPIRSNRKPMATGSSRFKREHILYQPRPQHPPA